MIADPIREAIRVFMDVKENVIDKLNTSKINEVGSKLRTRAREVPEMILELGLVPTLSYCLSKASVNNILKIIKVIKNSSESEQLKDIKNVESEKLAYALYTYVLLNYLSLTMGKVGNVELRKEDLVNENDVDRASNMIIRYMEALMESSAKSLIYGLLQSYLLQFKRLCEATFEPEKGG